MDISSKLSRLPTWLEWEMVLENVEDRLLATSSFSLLDIVSVVYGSRCDIISTIDEFFIGVSSDYDHSNPKVIHPDKFDVRVGSAYSDKGGELFYVKAVYAKFEDGGMANDIGMLKLKKRITLDGSTKKIIKLPSSSAYYPKEDTDVYIQGFGTNPNNPDTYQMSRANLYTITTDKCNDELIGEAGVTEKQICAKGDNDESGPCAVSF